MAGAPRTWSWRMALATNPALVQVSTSQRPGSSVWSIMRRALQASSHQSVRGSPSAVKGLSASGRVVAAERSDVWDTDTPRRATGVDEHRGRAMKSGLSPGEKPHQTGAYPTLGGLA